MPVTIRGENISKKYGRTVLFRGISLSLDTGQSLAITGRNGSGKSTLLRILAGFTSPSAGTVSWERDGKALERYDLFGHMGFSAPAMNLYEELSGMENLRFAGSGSDSRVMKELISLFELTGHENKAVRFYSSGMKQRLKLACCLANSSPVLLLDEPGTNLDRRGKDSVFRHLDSIRKDRIIIIATNEEEEAALCGGRLDLGR